jgi:hypothetical protein
VEGAYLSEVRRPTCSAPASSSPVLQALLLGRWVEPGVLAWPRVASHGGGLRAVSGRTGGASITIKHLREDMLSRSYPSECLVADLESRALLLFLILYTECDVESRDWASNHLSGDLEVGCGPHR